MQDRKGRSIVYEPPTQIEKMAIHQGLQKFMKPEAVKQFLHDCHILIGRGRRQEVYLLSGALWRFYQKTRTHRHPYFVGLYMGDFSDEKFKPSLHVLHRLVANINESVRVVVTKQGEQRFLYGRDLDAAHFQREVTFDKESRIVLLVNSQGEGLGYGDMSCGEGKPRVIKNRKDLGWYLRRGH